VRPERSVESPVSWWCTGAGSTLLAMLAFGVETAVRLRLGCLGDGSGTRLSYGKESVPGRCRRPCGFDGIGDAQGQRHSARRGCNAL